MAHTLWGFQYEECEYSILFVMSELSTMRCDRALGLWIASTRGVECRRRAAVEVLWPMDRAVDGGEGQPGGGFLSLPYKTKEADGG